MKSHVEHQQTADCGDSGARLQEASTGTARRFRMLGAGRLRGRDQHSWPQGSWRQRRERDPANKCWPIMRCRGRHRHELAGAVAGRIAGHGVWCDRCRVVGHKRSRGRHEVRTRRSATCKGVIKAQASQNHERTEHHRQTTATRQDPILRFVSAHRNAPLQHPTAFVMRCIISEFTPARCTEPEQLRISVGCS